MDQENEDPTGQDTESLWIHLLRKELAELEQEMSPNDYDDFVQRLMDRIPRDPSPRIQHPDDAP